MRTALVMLLLCGALASSACTSPGSAPTACMVAAPTECLGPRSHYADVAPIIDQRCVGPCHSGLPEGPWPLTDYEHVADWADVVRGDLLNCWMPPADSGVTLPDDERLAILTWIRCGYPE